MSATITVSSPIFSPRKHYHDVLSAIRSAAGEWIVVDQETVAGSSVPQRQSALIAAATRNGVKIETGSRDGVLFARLKPTL